MSAIFSSAILNAHGAAREGLARAEERFALFPEPAILIAHIRSAEAGVQCRDRVQLGIDRAQLLLLGSFRVVGDDGDNRGQQRAYCQYGSDVTQLESQSDHRR